MLAFFQALVPEMKQIALRSSDRFLKRTVFSMWFHGMAFHTPAAYNKTSSTGISCSLDSTE